MSLTGRMMTSSVQSMAGMMPARGQRRAGTPRPRQSTVSATQGAAGVFWESAYPPALEEGPGSMTARDALAQRRIERLALGAGLVTVVFWASAFVGIRAAAIELSPGPLALGRLLVASVVLGIMVAIRRPALPTRRDLVSIIAIGVLWFGIYFLALNAAERQVDAGTAAMLVNVAPIFVVILSGLFLGEGFPPRLLIGCVIA